MLFNRYNQHISLNICIYFENDYCIVAPTVREERYYWRERIERQKENEAHYVHPILPFCPVINVELYAYSLI